MKKELDKVFQEVRRNFIWTTDTEHELYYDGKVIKMREHWGLMRPDVRSALRGDCEDSSLYCSKLLKEELRIPKSKRKFTYCQTEIGEGHMVQFVKDGDGEYVFDNRQSWLVTLWALERSGYRNFAKPNGPVNGPWHPI